MLKRCIAAENRKLHASPIWAMFFLLPVISACKFCSNGTPILKSAVHSF